LLKTVALKAESVDVDGNWRT